MFKRLLLPSSMLLLLVLCMSCAEREEPYLCTTCPEIDPAYAAAFAYIEDNGEQIGLRPGVDALMPYWSGVDQMGMTHIRFNQHYHGIRVVGGEIIIHVDSHMAATRYNGMLVPGIVIDHRPQLTADTCLIVAEQHFDSLGFSGGQERNGEMVVYRFLDTDHLCWNYVLRDEAGLDILEYFIDANTAAIVHWQDMIIIG